MNTEDFKIITDYIYRVCGIALGQEKEYLLIQRLEPIALEFGCPDLSCFAKMLVGRTFDTSLREKVIEAITTNETSFFRDIQPFIDFNTIILPALVKLAEVRSARIPARRGSKIAIWSAASSTGQEAYTLAMLITEYLAGRSTSIVPQDFLITGTDISSQVLSQAMAGEYSESEISRGLSFDRKLRHFEQIGSKWVAKPHLRELVMFRQLNLMDDFTFLGGFDIIFCRNVLIYFDTECKRKILYRMNQMLSEEGVLVLGSVENVYGISDRFESYSCGGSNFYTPIK